MKHEDVITLPQIIGKIPELATHLPNLIKGSRLAKITDANKPLGLGLALERSTDANPNGVAVISQNSQLSYLQFNGWVNQIASVFTSLGLVKGDVAVVSLQNRPEMLATIAACSKIGVCAALINTSQRGKVLTHSINLVEPKVAIIGEEQTAAIEEVRADLDIDANNFFYFADQDTLGDPGTAPKGYNNLADMISEHSTENPASTHNVFLKDPAFYIYTSGTTGLPKAVVFNQGRFEKAYGGFGFASIRLTQSDRLYCTMPLYHATALAIGWGSVLAGNGCIVLSRKFSASRFWDEVRHYDCTAFVYVGELCRYLFEKAPKPNDRNNKIHVMFGNGLRPSIWKAFKDRFDIERVVEFYASSEGNVGFTNVFNFNNTVGFSPMKYAIVQYDKDAEQPVRNAKGFMIKVKKGESGLMLGEISPKTPFDGYTDAAKTEKSIFRDVFKKGDAWFNSGDLMRDIGFNHAQFVDRLGDTFRWKGENVSTTEVEQTLDGFESIIESVVYGVEIPNTNGRAGMAELRIEMAHDKFDYEELVSYLKRELPHYAVPLFLRINQQEMETTATFKHQKNKLKQQAYHLDQQDNPVYVLLPGEACYRQLDAATEAKINQGGYQM